jgi:hypothetical protein
MIYMENLFGKKKEKKKTKHCTVYMHAKQMKRIKVIKTEEKRKEEERRRI